MKREVRVRFAPSPTGPLHIGGVRTALFNYLFARKHGGKFLLRIEDTDQTRFVPGAEEYIIESLKWCGMNIDEGVSAKGPHAPYRQSERKDIYKKYCEQLIESGNAYYAFDTPEELGKIRTQYESEKKTFSYDHKIRGSLNNSLSLSGEQVKEKIDAGEPYVVRFKMPEDETLHIKDMVRGEIKFNTSTLDDKVLFKSDGLPTYHLANVVDDKLMEISHVIRGEEWLPSLPLHYMLYRTLGWESEAPEFAHLPLILKPTGKGKLSKRDGDKMGFPVFPLEWKAADGETSRGYREDGYLPEAMVNMLALLGWNPGTEEELFSLEKLSELFSIERVNKSGARFDPDKAKWFNQQYIQQKPNAEIAIEFKTILEAKGIAADISVIEKTVALTKERVQFVSELWEQASFFFAAPDQYDAKVVKKRWKGFAPAHVESIKELLAAQNEFGSTFTEELVKRYITEKEASMGLIMNALRLAIVGAGKGPHLFDIMEIIGQTETVKRIETALEKLGKEA